MTSQIFPSGTVEPHLADTLNSGHPRYNRQFRKSRLSFHSLQYLKQPLNSGHPATPYNRQLLRSQLYANNTQRLQFSGHWSTHSARLPIIAAVVNNLMLLASAEPSLPAYSKGKLWKCNHVVLNSPITHTTPTRTIPEAPELEHHPLNNKMLVPNGVHFRGIPLYIQLITRLKQRWNADYFTSKWHPSACLNICWH